MSSDRREGPARLARPTEFDELFGRGYPNPDRVGCPPREVLVSLARRERPIDDSAYDHIKECSPCYLEGRAIQEADALQQRRRVLTWAAAAVVALATGAGAWVLTTRNGSVATEFHAQLDLRPYAIMRGETQTAARPPLKLPRGRVSLTLLLPAGSEPGPYDVEVSGAGAVSRASARGDAELRNQITTLDITVVTGSFPRGCISSRCAAVTRIGSTSLCKCNELICIDLLPLNFQTEMSMRSGST